jgi:hypothetical protein
LIRSLLNFFLLRNFNHIPVHVSFLLRLLLLLNTFLLLLSIFLFSLYLSLYFDLNFLILLSGLDLTYLSFFLIRISILYLLSLNFLLLLILSFLIYIVRCYFQFLRIYHTLVVLEDFSILPAISAFIFNLLILSVIGLGQTLEELLRSHDYRLSSLFLVFAHFVLILILINL